MCLPLYVGDLCWSLFWYALLYVLSSFAIILTRKKELVALSCYCKCPVALPHRAVGWSAVCDWYFLIILTFYDHILKKLIFGLGHPPTAPPHQTPPEDQTEASKQNFRLICSINIVPLSACNIARPAGLHYNHCVSLSIPPSVSN